MQSVKSNTKCFKTLLQSVVGITMSVNHFKVRHIKRNQDIRKCFYIQSRRKISYKYVPIFHMTETLLK